MTRSLLWFILALISILDGRSQFVYYDTDKATSIAVIQSQVDRARHTRDSLQELGFIAETFTILNVGAKLWMTIDGRLDVFEWRNGSWVNLYGGTYHGYNYKSQTFTFEGKLYSYRGYGFWREHGEIIEFLPEKGSWEIIPATKNLPFGIGYVSDSFFYSHGVECHEINLVDQTIRAIPCRYSIRGEIPHGREYFFDDYVMIAGNLQDGSQIPLISKQSNDVYLSKRQPFFGLRDTQVKNSIIHIRGNGFTIYYPDGEELEYTIEEELKYYLLESDAAASSVRGIWLWLVLGVLLVVGIILFLFPSRSRSASDNDLMRLFNDFKGHLIDSDTLDQILGIDDITVYETRKHKRAALIREINTLSHANYGWELIVREKDPSDKRFYLYRIQ